MEDGDLKRVKNGTVRDGDPLKNDVEDLQNCRRSTIKPEQRIPARSKVEPPLWALVLKWNRGSPPNQSQISEEEVGD
jgi:hypothetical protein